MANPKLFHTYLGTTRVVQRELQVMHRPAEADRAEFDGREKFAAFLGDILDQGECGACYAFATTSCLQDRYRIFTNNEIRPTFNPLQALVCHPPELSRLEHQLLSFDESFQDFAERKTKYTACDGGTLDEIATYFYRLGAVENDCVEQTSIQRYIDQNNELPVCNRLANASTCETDSSKPKRYWPVQDMYIVSESDDLDVIATAMKADICANGPLLAGFWIYQDFLDSYDGKSIYIPKPNQQRILGHAIKVIGWGTGVVDGKTTAYWQCANSWGPTWGDNGFFKLQMANEMLELEYNHLGMIPQVPGILRFFDPPLDSARPSLDLSLRLENNVNPFTLLTAEATQYCLDHDIPITIIFAKPQYDAATFCCDDSDPRLAVTISLGVVCVALVIALLLVWRLR